MLAILRKYLADLLLNVLPNHCIYCLSPSSKSICQICLAALPTLKIQCPRCAEPNHHGEICGHCISRPPSFDQVICPYVYSGPVVGLINKLKNQTFALGSDHITDTLIEQLKDHHFDLIIPVPYHWRRLIQREYNPVRELAIKVGKKINTPWLDGLIRSEFQPSQKNLNRKQRLSNLKGAFALASLTTSTHIKGKNILLIDDVVTTGATCHSAAQILKRAGAKSISVACLARTPV